uniref:Uncharacterized protein n=1 Tax=Amphimedon queenslandica TaxID=400682 RepID=A0A1X7UMI0_AMPQE
MASSSASTSAKPKRECVGLASGMILEDVFNICRKSKEYVLKWFRREGIIGDVQDYDCPSCGCSGNMRLMKDSSYSKDTMVWKCSNRKCNKKVKAFSHLSTIDPDSRYIQERNLISLS